VAPLKAICTHDPIFSRGFFISFAAEDAVEFFLFIFFVSVTTCLFPFFSLSQPFSLCFLLFPFLAMFHSNTMLRSLMYLPFFFFLVLNCGQHSESVTKIKMEFFDYRQVKLGYVDIHLMVKVKAQEWEESFAGRLVVHSPPPPPSLLQCGSWSRLLDYIALHKIRGL
jgi:hypothetical protein